MIDQLISLAKLAFMLLYIYRRNKNHFITKDLYCDIHSTIQDAFVCTAKYQKKETDISLYLYQLGTDQLELLFGHVRTISHASNCDFLELKQRLVIALQIAKVYKDHPDWKSKCRLATKSTQKETLDHSSVHAWTGELSTKELNLASIWNLGKNGVSELLES